jgi:hypothetical protein
LNLGDFYRPGLFYICAINRRFLLWVECST